MKIGILSDSHDRIQPLRRALQTLDAAGAEVFIHCGDVGGLDALAEFAGRRAWFVWGNTDDPAPAWRRPIEAWGLPWPEGPLDLQLDGKRIAVFHGHERDLHAVIDTAEHDYLLYGHTHQKDDRRWGRMRAVNPGALHRVAVKTVALLDLETDDLRFIEIR